MKRYWDLSERERAALSHEDVEGFAAVELMEKGVVRASEPAVMHEPTVPEPAGHVFVARLGYHHSEVAFATEEEARASVRGALGRLAVKSIGADWSATVQLSHLQPFDIVTPGEEVRRVPIYTREQIDALGQLIEAGMLSRAENKRLRAQAEKQRSAEAEALKDLWADWHAQRARARHMARIAEVWEEYLELADDVATAGRFLRKAFGDDAVGEALEWGAVGPAARGIGAIDAIDRLRDDLAVAAAHAAHEAAPAHEAALEICERADDEVPL